MEQQVAFLLSKLPETGDQLLALGTILNVVGVVLWGFIALRVCYIFSPSESDEMKMGCIAIGVFSVIAFSVSAYHLLLIYFAPNLYVIQQVLGMFGE